MTSIQLVEVGTRDGFQSVGPFIPTATKVAVIDSLYDAGVRRIEATSFVSPSAVPQLADAAEVLARAAARPGMLPQVLVPTVRQAARALEAGARHLAFVLSVSDRHNQSNVRRSPQQSVAEYAEIVRMMPPGSTLRLNVATAFDCPFDGRVEEHATLALLEHLVAVAPSAEIALCDTTGRVYPDRVGKLFDAVQKRFPQVGQWAFHAHDTYGLGAANVLAAWQAGVRVFDSSIAGLGGCPFAPGATGNVASEDLVWMFEGMGIDTGINLRKLVEVGLIIAALPGAQVGGRVREAFGRSCKPHSAVT